MTGNDETSYNVVIALLVEISVILRIAQEGQSSDISTFVPSLSNTPGNVDLREIYRGRSRHPRQSHKQRGARGDVRVLHVSSIGTGISEILMVEEVSDHVAIGK